MGVAAYNRGNAVISRQLQVGAMDRLRADLNDLNATPKDPGAVAPWGPVDLVPGHEGWWAECPTTGHGYWYRSLRAALRAWRIAVVSVGMKGGVICYRAVPA
jgi:hypothetical protein